MNWKTFKQLYRKFTQDSVYQILSELLLLLLYFILKQEGLLSLTAQPAACET